MMNEKTAVNGAPAWRGWALFAAGLVATFLLGLLAANVLQRREEARLQRPSVPLAEDETDPARWGLNHPRQYETYRMQKDDTTRTKFGGSFPRDYLEEHPTIGVLFAGNPFSKDFRQARGHIFAVEDVTQTKRISAQSPGTCMACKSADVPKLMQRWGIAEFYAKKFDEVKAETKHPIACADCHKPNTMELQITRPALREALEAMGRDLATISHQEMRSLVCAQCHVEYYFKGEGKYLTFPWKHGLAVEDMERYYDEIDFTDWTHAVSKTKMLKMQHPDYEVYSTGIHAFRQVACADCHMPYRTEGGVKYTNHHIRSPLLDVANSCAVCHRWSEKEIIARVESIQSKVREGLTTAEETIARAHFDIAAAAEAGADDAQLAEARKAVRRAQMRWDYVAASNGMGFHSPLECMRVLTGAVELAGQSRRASARVLAARGIVAETAYPDFSTKEKMSELLKQFESGQPPRLLPQ